MYPTSRLIFRASATQSAPATRAQPLVGRASPTRILIVVVLPAPLGPTKPRICPRSTAIVNRSSATNVPYVFVKSLVSTRVSAAFMLCASLLRPAGDFPLDVRVRPFGPPPGRFARPGTGPE